jgi:hypothetical protein
MAARNAVRAPLDPLQTAGGANRAAAARSRHGAIAALNLGRGLDVRHIRGARPFPTLGVRLISAGRRLDGSRFAANPDVQAA